MDFFLPLPFYVWKIFSPRFVTLGFCPLDGTVTTSNRDRSWPPGWTGLKLGQDCCHWVNKPQQVRSDPDQYSGNIYSTKSSRYHSSSCQSVVHFGIAAQQQGLYWQDGTSDSIKDKLNLFLFRINFKQFQKSRRVMCIYEGLKLIYLLIK